ncbi:GDSL-type esterase/lipase family protein [Mucilaginibacter sp. UYCu711]|uniref:SGNH/GDSL hydrolase family protein n=1 Tax=Mucilaginibacter sp. UYCu711 TaxID=3156339 RepID=UPI003D25F26B
MERRQVTIFNTGVNGHNTADLLFRLDEDVLSKNPQLVLLMVGTNDMLSDANILTYKAYEANYQLLITRIKPHAKLVLMTIAPINEGYILERVKPSVYGNISPQAKVDGANDIVRQLAAKNECRLIDINHVLKACGGSGTEPDSLFMNVANADINDGVHPTANGYKVIATAVYQALSIAEPGVNRIVCFGDSITYGYKMEGQGTVEGDPYPAVLNRLFNNL